MLILTYLQIDNVPPIPAQMSHSPVVDKYIQ